MFAEIHYKYFDQSGFLTFGFSKPVIVPSKTAEFFGLPLCLGQSTDKNRLLKEITKKQRNLNFEIFINEANQFKYDNKICFSSMTELALRL